LSQRWKSRRKKRRKRRKRKKKRRKRRRKKRRHKRCGRAIQPTYEQPLPQRRLNRRTSAPRVRLGSLRRMGGFDQTQYAADDVVRLILSH
jgi:hypothetical protein